ncbi:site-specific DNA-methyltransferase [Faucicola atlantae]|uniref:site-specific DNA-methyltransferase (adenine-specific) n=1 Tax=Faucicola atlantae TaxID=34059 RepID=A0A1B8QGP6_9GAMM|nr:site-specific DNA-methyltransferase [Moraxella atlantae]OBX81203.1 DNA methylase [Moraxella atlantae]
MTTLKMHTPNLVDSNIDRIAELFPNCITEKPKTDEQGNVLKDASGQAILERGIDFELLKQELSHSVIDGSQERYRLDWVGKREAIVTANSPIAKTLRPCRAESVDFDTTGNLFIEGDNLEALKLLQESYLGKVKMIYIDPPYNTGNDFIYNDDFAADTAEFFERSGQVDADGNRLVANTERNGRFHSDWLSMMYSRLKLARNLLSDDGVIFISIDENEVDNLKKIGLEIFGSSNFIGNIAVINNPKGRSDQKNLATAHEYLLTFQKSNLAILKGFKAEEHITKRYNREDEKGLWREIDLRKTGDNDRAEDRPNMFYPFYWNENKNLLTLQKLSPDDIEILPMKNTEEKGCWRWGKSTAQSNLDNLYARYMPNKQQWSVFEKDYFDESNLIKSTTVWNFKDVNSERGTESFVKNLGFEKKFFTSPKPLGTITRALLLATDKNALILDFFAGSSTTAHAVMQLNAEDGGNRKFIMVQIPEPTDPKSEAFKAGYPTIAEISKERIRRAGAKIKADNADKEGITELDTGFRVLKIDTSNMNDIYYRPQDYTQDLLNQLETNIKADRSDEDLLFQFMLDTGVPLSLPIERTTINGHTIYQVGGNSLIASLDHIDATMVNDIAKMNPLKFITSERAIATDSDKTNIKERFKQLSPHTDVRFI